MNLYELSIAFQKVQNMDLDPEVMQDTLDSIEGTLESKLENTVKVIRNRKARREALKAEEDRLKKARQSEENAVKWLETYVKDNLKLIGKNKYEAGMFKLSIQKNPVSVNITDKKILPEDYLIPQPPKVNNTTLKKALKDGIEVPGAELKQTEGLRIR